MAVILEQLFFDLLRVSIGNQSHLSRTPSADGWGGLYTIAEKQSLLGVCFEGVRRCVEAACNEDAEIEEALAKLNLPEEFYYGWMSVAFQIEERNEVVNGQCVEIQRMLAEDGFRSCILKGQGVASLYGVLSRLRQSGDIDVWAIGKPGTVIEWARRTGSMYRYDYHHADLSLFEKTGVELHYRPTLSRNLLRNAKLQKWFRENGPQHIEFKEEIGFSMPDYVLNVVLTINHNFWHLLYEGVGMRHMMDLYFVLRSLDNVNSGDGKAEAWKLIKHFNLERFAKASMWIIQNGLGLEQKYLLCEADAGSGRFLLEEIMMSGNFGKYDDRLKGKRSENRLKLMYTWMRHTLRLIKYYPADVLWTPIGVLGISLWRRWRYRNDYELRAKH